MNFKVDERYNAVVLQLKGNVMGGPDGAAVLDHIRELKEGGKTNIVADLGKVNFMNSSGLGMLISGMTTLRNAGGDLRLAKVDGRIKSLLMITKLITVFKHYDSVDDAVGSFEDEPPAAAPEE